MARVPWSCSLALLLALVAGRAWSQADSQARLREAETQYETGMNHMRREAFVEAEQAFKRALASEPRYYMANFGLGQAYLAQKRYADAIGAYNACRETVRDLNSAWQREQVEAERQREDEIRDARQIIQRLQGTTDTNPTAQADIIRLEARIETLQQSKMRGQDQRYEIPAGLYVGLGSAYLRTGQLAEAEEAYESAIAADSGLGEAHNNLAFVYFKTGRYDLALAEIEAAEKAGVKVHPQFKKDVKKAAAE